MPRDSETTKSDRELLEEMSARARRLETKTTKIANYLGVDVDAEKPHIMDGVVYVSTLKVSLQDVVEAIGDTTGPIPLYCGEDFIVRLNV